MPLGENFGPVLVAAREGQEWAFAALYRELNPRLFRYFASRAPAEAEDLCAETWLGAARTLGSFEGDERAFSAWIFSIAHRRLVQHWRDTSRRPPKEQASPGGERAGPDDVEGAALEKMAAVEAARTIAAVLSADQAEVVLLRVLGGLDVDQVAGILGKRAGTVRALQHKGLRRLASADVFARSVDAD